MFPLGQFSTADRKYPRSKIGDGMQSHITQDQRKTGTYRTPSTSVESKNAETLRNSNLISIDGISIPEHSKLCRIPTRPKELQDDNFSDRFDYKTLFYDAVRSDDDTTVRIIAPALLNLEALLAESGFYLPGSDEALDYRIRNLDRQSQIILTVPARTGEILLKGAIGSYTIVIRQNGQRMFADKRVVFVQSKNNNLIWIRDWLQFYKNVHGANAVLFYDNGSTDYSTLQLMETLEGVEGIDTVVVVSWPFKHGPVGKGLNKYWDSDFSKLGMLEHARWTFLGAARSALNCDIDELVITRQGDSIFARAEKSIFGVDAFRGNWVHGIEGVTRIPKANDPLRFMDFSHSFAGVVRRRLSVIPFEPMRCQPKWAVVPSRTPVEAQWHVHQIKGWWASRLMDRNVRFRHFSEINTSWKYNRVIRDPSHAIRQLPDSDMRRDFEKAGWGLKTSDLPKHGDKNF